MDAVIPAAKIQDCWYSEFELTVSYTAGDAAGPSSERVCRSARCPVLYLKP